MRGTLCRVRQYLPVSGNICRSDVRYLLPVRLPGTALHAGRSLAPLQTQCFDRRVPQCSPCARPVLALCSPPSPIALPPRPPGRPPPPGYPPDSGRRGRAAQNTIPHPHHPLCKIRLPKSQTRPHPTTTKFCRFFCLKLNTCFINTLAYTLRPC